MLAEVTGWVLRGLVLLIACTVFALLRPKKACGKCSGNGSRQRRRTRTACPRCGGTGRQFRFGAVAARRVMNEVHAYVRAAIERWREERP